jgi:hypothetical protein
MDDPGLRDQQGTDPSHSGLAFARFVWTHQSQSIELIRAANLEQMFEPLSLSCCDGHDQLPASFMSNRVRRAVFVQRFASGRAKSGFQ